MKILVIFTGGTIGSSIKNGIADVDSEASKILLGLYTDRSDIEFECVSPFNILSENSTCATLSMLCGFMKKIDFHKYDGIIITHGSDTLAYTSSMLGLVLSWAEIPIIITAANYVLSVPQSNGIANFKASVDFISDFSNRLHKNTGVFTVWKNNGEPVKVHISTRLNEADGYLDSFCSWGGVEFGIIENGHFKHTDNILNPDFTKPCKRFHFLKNLDLNFKNEILLLHSYVGLDFNSVNINGKSAVLLKLYHSATACVNGNETSFAEFSKKCIENGTEVYVYSCKNSDYRYKSSENIEYNLIIPLYNINTASAYCKLLLAYCLDKESRTMILSNSLFYETLDPQTSEKASQEL